MAPSLRRFYIDHVFSNVGEILQLSPRETFHLHRVLRLKAGDTCRIFNGQGFSAEARIETISENKGAELRLESIVPLNKLKLRLKVVQAVPQRKKMDELVDRAEELGVQELWVIETQRTIVRMRPEAAEQARKRWERIIVEAAKQSGNPVLMKMEGPLAFEKMVQEKIEPGDQSFIFHPDPSGISFQDMIDCLRETDKKNASRAAVFFFGPEGGFTEEEVRLAESRGVRKVFLGQSILRLETAFLGVISAVRFLVP